MQPVIAATPPAANNTRTRAATVGCWSPATKGQRAKGTWADRGKECEGLFNIACGIYCVLDHVCFMETNPFLC